MEYRISNKELRRPKYEEVNQKLTVEDAQAGNLGYE
jgi:hypothetical protein